MAPVSIRYGFRLALFRAEQTVTLDEEAIMVSENGHPPLRLAWDRIVGVHLEPATAAMTSGRAGWANLHAVGGDPIMMTTLAARMGTLPIALSAGASSELRQPLGVAVVGGLIVSQLLTLFITPVIYLYMEDLSAMSRKLAAWIRTRREPHLSGELLPAE